MIDRNEKMNRSIEVIKRETTFKIENLIQLNRSDKIKCLTYFIMLSVDWFENALASSVFKPSHPCLVSGALTKRIS